MTISGIDGSGKTTLAEIVGRELRKSGLEVVHIYGRFAPERLSIISKLFRRLRLRDTPEDSFPEDYGHHRELLLRKAAPRGLYRLFVVIAYILGLKRMMAPLLRRDVLVVCDRYLLDTWVLDLRLGTAIPARRDLGLLKLLYELLPLPDLALVIDVPPEIALGRRPKTLPAPLLQQAIDDYRFGVPFVSAYVLDGTLPVDAIREKALSLIRTECR